MRKRNFMGFRGSCARGLRRAPEPGGSGSNSLSVECVVMEEGGRRAYNAHSPPICPVASLLRPCPASVPGHVVKVFVINHPVHGILPSLFFLSEWARTKSPPT